MAFKLKEGMNRLGIVAGLIFFIYFCPLIIDKPPWDERPLAIAFLQIGPVAAWFAFRIAGWAIAGFLESEKPPN